MTLPYRRGTAPLRQIRTAPWIWDFYRRIYNTCTCDWGRMHDWPAEQVGPVVVVGVVGVVGAVGTVVPLYGQR